MAYVVKALPALPWRQAAVHAKLSCYAELYILNNCLMPLFHTTLSPYIPRHTVMVMSTDHVSRSFVNRLTKSPWDLRNSSYSADCVSVLSCWYYYTYIIIIQLCYTAPRPQSIFFCGFVLVYYTKPSPILHWIAIFCYTILYTAVVSCVRCFNSPLLYLNIVLSYNHPVVLCYNTRVPNCAITPYSPLLYCIFFCAISTYSSFGIPSWSAIMCYIIL